jgi:hypothetical protein
MRQIMVFEKNSEPIELTDIALFSAALVLVLFSDLVISIEI